MQSQSRATSKKLFLALTSLVLMLASVRSAMADPISLMWDANPEPQVAGYIVHVGTQSGTYTQHLDVGNSTTYLYPSAVAGQRYCFAVSAYFAGPIEGTKSAEVCGYSDAPPTLANPGNQQSVKSQSATLQLQGSDPYNQPVTYSATGLPPGLTLMASTGFISGTPTTAGSSTVTAKVSDGILSASQTFTWTILAPDTTAPTVTITGPTSAATYATLSPTVTLSGTASDSDGVLQVTWANNRGGNGTASGTTSWSVAGVTLQAGVNLLTISASDASGNTATAIITVTYNVAPTLATVSNQSSRVGLSDSLQLVGDDANGDVLTYSATGVPGGLSLNAATGLISGTPTTVGSYTVTVRVSDGPLSKSRTFTWSVKKRTGQ